MCTLFLQYIGSGFKSIIDLSLEERKSMDGTEGEVMGSFMKAN